MTALSPSADLERTRQRPDGKLPAGWDAHLHGLGALPARWRARHLAQEAALILERASKLQSISTDDLREALKSARRQLRRSGGADGDAVQAGLAALVEAAHRLCGLRAYPEQVMGALALRQGFFAEMSTGEGKTLVIGLAAASGAWLSPALHVITANDYLAARDATWLGPFYSLCGLTVGCVAGGMPEEERRAGYHAAITYSTPKEVVADFLRDRLRLAALASGSRRLAHGLTRDAEPVPLVMRGLHHAVIDEADYALIDESVTPLIISREHENKPLVEASRVACEIARSLQREVDYIADERLQWVELQPRAAETIARATAALPKQWRGLARRVELITQALTAREFFHFQRQYLIEDGKVVIVDEATGRVMPQRTWRQGLHQAIEAKEELEITSPTETLARLSFQRFFRRYLHLAGITGTGREAAAECWHVYHLPFVRIPTHRPCVREQWPDRIFSTGEEKWSAIVEEIQRVHATGRPLLIGVRSVRDSRQLAEFLSRQGLCFRLLNAEHHQEEAAIIAGAGEAGRITIATNMAGRGTDIKLGAGVADLGGLHVIASERHETRRVDRQLFGRAGRQGDAGSAQVFCALNDDLPRRFAPAWARALTKSLALAGQTPPAFLCNKIILHSQRAAERRARQQRAAVLQADDWLDDSLGFCE